ncbi:VraH family protein [Staphylococcus epidermidis]|nr:VraH family protein [Staphylococcus epidermidis]MCC3673988.1 VraH family protein [Staphylococcus epidermidis]MCG1078361.1 VraH family protein [Staphylococcus epidermidis]MCG1151176.1 VraH family protein [Staphylococcus epidermidis]MCG1153437.1 VraH family protein [Staphylococcus epidermidis]MCG1245331.1 VraH family protein [Staphylococcus epidermidis]
MSLKEIWKVLINKKWQTEEICYLILYIFLASIFTTPLFGIPLGVLAYLYLNEEILKQLAYISH